MGNEFDDIKVVVIYKMVLDESQAEEYSYDNNKLLANKRLRKIYYLSNSKPENTETTETNEATSTNTDETLNEESGEEKKDTTQTVTDGQSATTINIYYKKRFQKMNFA